MRAACKLAAQVLEYAGTLVKVRNLPGEPKNPVIHQRGLLLTVALAAAWRHHRLHRQESAPDDHGQWRLPLSPHVRWVLTKLLDPECGDAHRHKVRLWRLLTVPWLQAIFQKACALR